MVTDDVNLELYDSTLIKLNHLIIKTTVNSSTQ